jgi:hypothetical protein
MPSVDRSYRWLFPTMLIEWNAPRLPATRPHTESVHTITKINIVEEYGSGAQQSQSRGAFVRD